MHIPRFVSVPALLLVCAATSVAQPPRKASPDSKTPQAAQSHKGMISAMQKSEAQRDAACYTMRDYLFRKGDNSSVPKLKDYSTCEQASLFELREVTATKK